MLEPPAARPSRPPTPSARISDRPGRRFHIGDGLTLIAASAVALTLVRTILPEMMRGPGPGLPTWALILTVSICLVVVATPALLLLRLGRPRPTLRRLSCRPGFVATLAASVVLALYLGTTGLLTAIRLLVRTGSSMGFWWIEAAFRAIPMVGPAVIASWVLLAVSGRRRPHRGGFDILGRVLGAAWITLFVISSVARVIFGVGP